MKSWPKSFEQESSGNIKIPVWIESQINTGGTTHFEEGGILSSYLHVLHSIQTGLSRKNMTLMVQYIEVMVANENNKIIDRFCQILITIMNHFACLYMSHSSRRLCSCLLYGHSVLHLHDPSVVHLIKHPINCPDNLLQK